ncbi:MAG: flagellar type III secretion system protein FlhB [Gammaproteobacteria bacterium]|nr:flagellar type III secretion system protein FlhB [Gammaproteobacteria bacterium]MBU1646158.1 flagellar type III secretion system protein FlhB [Gammaproteobacteria bacterium]MBU1972220.1 flagellar type III secretion system protein FlhB [Gammaproteobacteria bacterium]
MAEESDLEKTEPPSSRRIEQARAEGQVPQSRELAAFLVMAMGVGGLWAFGDWFGHRARDIVSHGLVFDRRAAFDPEYLGVAFVNLSVEALTMVAPIFLFTVAAALLTPFAFGGWVLSSKALTPDPMRMDPLKGLKRMFSWQSIAELVKSVLKACLLGGIVWWVVRNEQDHLFALITQPIDVALTSTARILIYAALAMVSGLALIAMIDVPFQLWQYYTRLKMTREELKREYKELEGDPQLKARIRSQQRENSRKRMMSEVPKADVVVTNPTHFAVALKYDAANMGAPKVVAKGMNLVAHKIRELADEHKVPVVEAPPLARALYRHAEIGDQIPSSLYTAVAEVMAYIYQLNQYAAGAMGLLLPEPPTAIAVPDGLDPGSPDQ